ncbi:DmpA family aminopeptidase [Lentisalinibacter sediminis]|uniref:DmpA family aminopeptidase n=1 Tax=Lentisalinibacter sediminis TaxID=2992237 RepID=UPI00386F7ADF
MTVRLLILILAAALPSLVMADAPPRARDLGVPFDGTPGPRNAITDVDGVLVGHVTLIEGEGALEPGKGPVRTGVTAILPLGRDMSRSVAAGRAVINGTGEMTGSWLMDEVGMISGPIMLTGTSSVGIVHHATSRWIRDNAPPEHWVAGLIPVVAETLDLHLNDVWGYHVKPEHVYRAIDTAASGPVAEGNVGGGTGMVAYAFKGGIGTSSRLVSVGEQTYTVGVLLQANHGGRDRLRIAGVPVGREIQDLMPSRAQAASEKNSLVIVIATDAPLSATQLERLARRAALGVGRNGSVASFMSGELAVAFSTTNTIAIGQQTNSIETPTPWTGAMLNPLFLATVEAVEEALVNCLVAAETMTGANGLTVHALPEDRLQEILRKYNRLQETAEPAAVAPGY